MGSEKGKPIQGSEIGAVAAETAGEALQGHVYSGQHRNQSGKKKREASG